MSLSGAVGIRMTHMAQEWTAFSPCGVGYSIVQQGVFIIQFVCEIIVKSLKKVGVAYFLKVKVYTRYK